MKGGPRTPSPRPCARISTKEPKMKLKNMAKTHFRVWLVDPVEKTIKPRFLDKRTREFGLDVQKMIGAGVLGHRKVGEIGVSGLHVAGDAEAPKGQVGFRFEGFDCEATSGVGVVFRSEEHTSELQSLMRISYAVFCLKKKKKKKS